MSEINYTKFVKTEKLPGVWCDGCFVPALLMQSAVVFDQLKFKNSDTAVVSGIGCTGRIAGYFNLDSVHSIHGRAASVAEGIKTQNPKMNVVVISGDGDLLSIGGNHLLHTSRRNPDITVICYNNEIYGLTGGQTSPETRKGNITLTSPQGSKFNRLNAQKIVSSNDKYFYGRTAIFNLDHFKKVLSEALKHKGFSFIEVMGFCYETDGRRRGYKKPLEMIEEMKKSYSVTEEQGELKDNELGINKN